MKDISILLIDSSFEDIERFVGNFKDENLSVLVAVTLEKAKTILSYIVPDIIVSEHELDGKFGKEILNFIKNHENYSNTPFIFLSKETDLKTKIKALYCGADDYITKPYSPKELVIRIQRILKRHNIRRFDIDRKIFSSTLNLNIIEILLLLEKTQKSGIFTVYTDHMVSVLHFKNGNIISANFGEATGEKAVYELLEVTDAIYEFEFRDEDFEVKIDSVTHSLMLEIDEQIYEIELDNSEYFVGRHNTTHSLVLEGLRRIDERKEAEKNSQVAKPAEVTSMPVKLEIFCVGFASEHIIHLFDESVYNVLFFENPKDALLHLEKKLPDLIVVRPQMPEINGFKLLRILANSSKTYYLPVVFISVAANEDEKIIALKEGAADYITPPISKYEFDAKIRKIINESALNKNEYHNVLRGSLNNFSVLELIQGIQGIEKTCMLTFYNGDDSCILFFKNGELLNAKIQHQEGEEAVHKILMWRRGYFEMKFKDYMVPKEIKGSTFSLILDGITKSVEKDKEEVEKSIKFSKEKTVRRASDSVITFGLYNFVIEMNKIDVKGDVNFCAIKVGQLHKYVSGGYKNMTLLVDLNAIDKESLDELMMFKKKIYENIKEGATIVCFTSRPGIYSVSGVLNKFSWLPNFDEEKEISEALSDEITIETHVDFFEFGEIIKSMYYTAAFPRGFGSPEYKPILFSNAQIPVALYKKIDSGYIFLMPQQQSKEIFINFFMQKIVKKLKKSIIF